MRLETYECQGTSHVLNPSSRTSVCGVCGCCGSAGQSWSAAQVTERLMTPIRVPRCQKQQSRFQPSMHARRGLWAGRPKSGCPHHMQTRVAAPGRSPTWTSPRKYRPLFPALVLVLPFGEYQRMGLVWCCMGGFWWENPIDNLVYEQPHMYMHKPACIDRCWLNSSCWTQVSFMPLGQFRRGSRWICQTELFPYYFNPF